MAIPSSGTITLDNCNVELGLASGTNISLNQANVRSLSGITTSGSTHSLSQLYGKSSLGTMWTSKTSNTTTTLTAVCYLYSGFVGGVASRFVAVGDNGRVVTSRYGTDWVVQNSGASINFRAIATDDNYVVATGDSGYVYYSSDSGATWHGGYVTGGYVNYGIAYGAGLFVTVGTYSYIFSSTTATSWTYRYSNGSYNLQCITYGGGLFITAGTSGLILASSDGINWYSKSSPVATAFMGAAYGNGMWVLVGTSGTIISSADGNTWYNRTSPTAYHLRAVAWQNNKFVAIGDNGQCAVSSDGITWTLATSFPTHGYGLCAITNTSTPRMVGVGYLGAIAASPT